MTPSHSSKKLDGLAAEISRLESETFEIADYADANDLFLASSTSSTSSTTSTTSCSA